MTEPVPFTMSVIDQLLSNLSIMDKGNTYRIDPEDKVIYYTPSFDVGEANALLEAHKGGMRPKSLKELRQIIAKLTAEDIENSPDADPEDEEKYDGEWAYKLDPLDQGERP